MSAARLAVAALLAALVLTFGAPPAGAAPRKPQPRVGDVALSNRTPTRADEVSLSSQGWRPGAIVTIALAGADVLRASADAHGVVHARLVIPDTAPRGFEVLSVTGAAATGVPQVIVTGLTVVVDHPAPAPTRPWGIVFVLVAGAALLLLASRRVTYAAARSAPAR